MRTVTLRSRRPMTLSKSGTDLLRQDYSKRRTLPRFAGDGHIPAHQLAKPPAKGQTQTRPAILLVSRGVPLGERFKQSGHLLRTQADAGVRNGKMQKAQ